MREKLRKTAIDIIGDVPWGTHFCLFYQSKEDLLDILVPYFKAGLENNEFCMWVTSEPLNVEEAKKSLKRVVDNLDDYIESGQIEILDYSQWYTKSGMFEAEKVLQGWLEKYDKAVKRGFDGLRLTGNTFWLKKRDWKDFVDYETVVDSVIRKYRILAICTYSLGRCRASDIMDVVSNHQFALIKREGEWKIIESAERRKAEEALREAKDYLDSLISYANAPIIVWNPEFKIIRFNHAFERLTGYAAKETIGKELNMLFPEATRDESFQKIAGTLSGEYWESVEISILCKDGDIRVVLWNSANIYAEDGTTLLSTIAQGIDITERKKAEEELKESQERYRALVENTVLGITIIDTNYKIITANTMIAKLFNKPASDFVGKNCFREYEKREAVCPHCPGVRAMASGKTTEVETQGVRDDGSRFYVRNRTLPFFGPDGVVKGFIEIVEDVTERKKAEESLQQLNKVLESTVQELSRSNQEIDDFAHVIAHNLKAPLRVIGTLTDWIATDYGDKFNQEGKEQIKLLKGRVMRMSELINSVLRYSEIRRVGNQRKKVNLNTLVTETIVQIAPPESIEITIENELPTLICEKTHLTEVFQNLLSNAVKYMDKPQGRVRIGCVEEDDFWKFSIADNGPGIKEQHFERIFKIFQTLLPCDELGSTGIGLTIVKKIAELYGGKIWLESKVGEGSTFLFTLPKQETDITSAKLYGNASS